MTKILALLFGMTLAASTANACTVNANGQPAICSQAPGLLAPGGNVDNYEGTAGPRLLAPGSDPQWDWDKTFSYAYIYSAPQQAPGPDVNNLTDHIWTITYSWAQNNPIGGSAPGSGHNEIVAVHCFVAANNGTVWYEVASETGVYNIVDGNGPPSQSIICPISGLDVNGLGPSDWVNSAGQSAASSITAAQSYYQTMSQANINIFAMGLVFGDNVCTPNWAGAAFPGNITCWQDGAFAAGSHFTVFSDLVQ